jgi:hypothetical protein
MKWLKIYRRPSIDRISNALYYANDKYWLCSDAQLLEAWAMAKTAQYMLKRSISLSNNRKDYLLPQISHYAQELEVEMSNRGLTKRYGIDIDLSYLTRPNRDIAQLEIFA